MMRVRIPFHLQRRKVYALVGESGTGKSFHAKLVAQKYRISLIIDDGLLIKDNRIIAGWSAKEEKSYMAAVRTALFDGEEHRQEVAARLAVENFRKVLILGTSDKMVSKIAGQVGLPQPSKFIRIEDIASHDEIETALRTRRIEGKHVIPAPQAEVKRSYADIFFDVIRIRQKKVGPPSIVVMPVHEKSLVRPLYSRHERVKISEMALSQMALLSINVYDADIKVKHIGVKNAELGEEVTTGYNHGYRLVLLVDLPDNRELSGLIASLQKYIIEDIERFTGILIEEVNIVIDKFTQM
jgi:ABC-type dipeptide/oligopeptide/nickel transport system ATPase component